MNFNYTKLIKCFENINNFIKSDSNTKYECILLSMENLMTFTDGKIINPAIYIKINEILTVVYNKPPVYEDIYTDENMKNILNIICNKICKEKLEELKQTMPGPKLQSLDVVKLCGDDPNYSHIEKDLIDCLCLQLSTLKVKEYNYLQKSRDIANFSNYDKKILHILSNNAIVDKVDKDGKDSQILKKLRKLYNSSTPRGIYLGYEFHNGIIFDDNSMYVKNKKKCLIFGDIHGDILPILEVFKNKGIDFTDTASANHISNYDIIFLGDIYDPFNNEFIIRSKKDQRVNGNVDEFNKNLINFANNDLYLTIVFVLFLAYSGARVYWVLGNHDINSFVLNPFFYATMNLLVNETKTDDIIIRIKNNLFICQKLFYNYNEKKLLLYHEPSCIYDHNDENNNSLLIGYHKILNEYKKTRKDENISIYYYQPVPVKKDTKQSTDKEPKECQASNQTTYYTSPTDHEVKNITPSTLSILFPNSVPKEIIKIYGHTYNYDANFYNMFIGNPFSFKKSINVVSSNIKSISLDHTTSFYKSTSNSCKIKNKTKDTSYDQIGTFDKESKIDFEKFFQEHFIIQKIYNTSDSINNNIEFTISFDGQKYNIKRNINNPSIKLADTYYLINNIDIINDPDLLSYKTTLEEVINFTIPINIKSYIEANRDYISQRLEDYRKQMKIELDKLNKLLVIYNLLSDIKKIGTNKSEKGLNDFKGTYDDFRNEIFMVNKHKLINTGKIDEYAIYGLIYFIYGTESNLTLESVDLKHCYENKMKYIINSCNPINSSSSSNPGSYSNPCDSLFGGIYPTVDILDIFDYLNKNPFIEKKLSEKFYYELIYYSIKDESFKSLYKRYITEYLYNYVYDVDHLSKYEYTKLDKKDFDTKNYINTILKLYNFLDFDISKHNIKKDTKIITREYSKHTNDPSFNMFDNRDRRTISPFNEYDSREKRKTQTRFNPTKKLISNNLSSRGGLVGGKIPAFKYEDAFEFIHYHSLERAWETDYFIINREFEDNGDNGIVKITLNTEYENCLNVQRLAFDFIKKLDLDKQMIEFIENSIKYLDTIQEINMIIVYIQYYLHQNEVYIDKQFALNIFYNVLNILNEEKKIKIIKDDGDGHGDIVMDEY